MDNLFPEPVPIAEPPPMEMVHRLFTVTVSRYDDFHQYHYGPFENRAQAEECVLILSSREDVTEAVINLEEPPCPKS